MRYKVNLQKTDEGYWLFCLGSRIAGLLVARTN